MGTVILTHCNVPKFHFIKKFKFCVARYNVETSCRPWHFFKFPNSVEFAVYDDENKEVFETHGV